MFLYAGFSPACSRANKDNQPGVMFESANAFYKENKFDEAIGEYNKIIESGFISANIYYNLANSYFKKGQIGKAVLNYERARFLKASDADLKANYEYARETSGIGSDDFKANVFFSWLDRAYAGFNLDEASVFIFFLQAVFFIILIRRVIFMKDTRFYALILSALAVLIILSCVGLKRKIDYSKNTAVVISPGLECRFEPFDSATTHFILEEGSKVMILDSSGAWFKIRRFDGKRGWVIKDKVEKLFPVFPEH